MRYFTLCLYSEGSSDRLFLERVLYRALVDGLTWRPRGNSTVQEQFVRFGPLPQGRRRDHFIVEQVRLLNKEISVIFVHADGGGNPEAALQRNCNPAVDQINAEQREVFGVAVVPVRETEAWALADIEAIRRSTGGRVKTLSHHNPEKILDPKLELKRIAKEAKALSPLALMAELADTVSLEALRRMQSFQAFEATLRWQLARIGAIQAH